MKTLPNSRAIRLRMAGSFGSRVLDEGPAALPGPKVSGGRQVVVLPRYEVLKHNDQFVGHKGVATVI